MEQNPDEMEEIMNKLDQFGLGNRPSAELETYDYRALGPTIVHESFWVLQLESMGFVDKDGKALDPVRAGSTSGARQTFVIYCYDEGGSFRITKECVGLPNSKTVLECVFCDSQKILTLLNIIFRALQRAIIEPTAPLKPCLPWFLMIAIKLSPHANALKPFLDSLPAPFHWKIETPEEAQAVHEGVDDLNQKGVKNALTLAERSKAAGNKAFSQRDRKAALKAYTEALSYITNVLVQNPTPEDGVKVKKLQAICLANRAATYIIPGEGSDPEKALEDGKAAETADPTYSKAYAFLFEKHSQIFMETQCRYIRQASASQQLGNMDDAQDAIARALRRKDLENDSGLVDRLIDLTTGGKGFSDDESTFKSWMVDVMLNNRKSSDRISGIKGEWERRCNAQFAKFKR